MSVDARLPKKRKRITALAGVEPKHIVSPGDVITEDTGYMRLVTKNQADSMLWIQFHRHCLLNWTE